MKGLAAINKESVVGSRTMVEELEASGYIEKTCVAMISGVTFVLPSVFIA